MIRKLIGVGWIIIAIFIGCGFFLALNPISRSVSWENEKKLAQFLKINYDLNECRHNFSGQKILEKLIKRIYPLDESDKKFSINVKILKSDEVNAFASLGGEIRINSALLESANSGEELAGVLAHEIEHVSQRHIIESIFLHFLTFESLNLFLGKDSSATAWLKYFSHITFSKEKEAQADRQAFIRLQKAQVSNQGIRDFFMRMENEKSFANFISDHPSNVSRIKMAQSFSNEDSYQVLNKDEWKILKNYCH
ncbi:MAG: M48 family metallopeptidase [Rickettsiales bacterium]|nr:M48 family metallopeptidase [Rickettsiales bacterium]